MTDPRPETLDREAFRIAEKVLERHPASRAYHERMYGPQVGEPDEVILSRALLAAEQRAEEAERVIGAVREFVAEYEALDKEELLRTPNGLLLRGAALIRVLSAYDEDLAPHKAAEEEK